MKIFCNDLIKRTLKRSNIIKKNYTFNPEDFGYKKALNFEELKNYFDENTFVKVTLIGRSITSNSFYDYSYAHLKSLDFPNGHWIIGNSKYEQEFSLKIQKKYINYSGLIPSKRFATNLLTNIFATPTNDYVDSCGKKILKRNINSKRFGNTSD